MLRRLLGLGLVAGAFVPGSTLSAQVCLTPKPLASCRSFAFFDAVGALGVVRATQAKHTQTDDDLPSYGGGMFGYMVNVDSANAFGASGEFDYGLSGRGSLKAHYRRWLPNHSAIELAAGPLAVDVFRQGNGGDERLRVHGYTADVAFIARQGIGVYAGIDHISVTNSPSGGAHVGVRLEKGWAAAAVGVTAAIFGAFWLPSDGLKWP